MSERLTRAMERLRAESARAAMPRRAEQILLAEFDRVSVSRRRHRIRLGWTLAAVSAAASIAVTAFLEQRPHVEPPTSPAAVSGNVPASEQASDPFVPIPYVAPLTPYERAEIVRMDIPVAALIAAGFPMRTADPGAQAKADVVVGQDGRARAVRLISISGGGQ